MIACVAVPHLPLCVELQRKPELRSIPAVITAGPRMNDTVLDCSPEAAACGIRPGMTVYVVLTLCREAAVVPADPLRYQQQFETMLRALEQVSPRVEPGELGYAYVDLKGLDGLYASAAGLLDALRQHSKAVCRVEPHIGLAAGKFPAKMAALQGQPGGCITLAPQGTPAFLAPLSVDTLPVSFEMRSRLWRLSLRTLGDLAALPFSAVQAQFGTEGAQAWRLARGDDTAPLVPRPQREPIIVRLAFEAPVTSLAAFTVAVRELVGRIYARPSGQALRPGSGQAIAVRQVRMGLTLEDGRSWERSYTPNDPVSAPQDLEFFLISKLETLGFPGPVSELALEVTASGGEMGRQGRLLHDSSRLENQVRAAARQLAVRYGHSPLMRVVAVEPWSRIPERRWALLTYEP